MNRFLINYWRNDRLRIFWLLGVSLLIVIGARLLLIDSYSMWWLVIVLSCLFAWYLVHASWLSGRAYLDMVDHYPLLRLWKANQKGERSILKAFLLMILIQYPIFYACALFLLALGCVFYGVEHSVNGKVSSYLDALYVVCIAATTIGFGDVYPVTGLGRILTLSSSLVGVVAFGVVSASCWQAIQSTYILFVGPVGGNPSQGDLAKTDEHLTEEQPQTPFVPRKGKPNKSLHRIARKSGSR